MRILPTISKPRRSPFTYSQDHQFFPPIVKQLHEREVAVWKRENDIPATLREAKEGETTEQLEAEREREQELINTAIPLTEEEQEVKTKAMAEGFEDWTKRDYQQFVKGVEKHYSLGVPL